MTDLEGRNPAKPAAFALRVFIDRGQGWKICLSIHTEDHGAQGTQRPRAN